MSRGRRSAAGIRSPLTSSIGAEACREIPGSAATGAGRRRGTRPSSSCRRPPRAPGTCRRDTHGSRTPSSATRARSTRGCRPVDHRTRMRSFSCSLSAPSSRSSCALHHDALRVDVAALASSRAPSRTSARRDVDQSAPPRCGHVDGEHPDAELEVAVDAGDHVLLARIETVDANTIGAGLTFAAGAGRPRSPASNGMRTVSRGGSSSLP